jgi:hypothetical protein
MERRLCLHHIGLRSRLVGRALVESGLWDVLAADKLLATPQLQSCVKLGSFCLGEIGPLLLDCRLIGGLFNAEQEVAGLDLLSFGEIALLDETWDPCHNVDFVDCRHTADEITCLRHLTAHHGGHRDRRRR